MTQADYDEQLAACPTQRDRDYVIANRESIIAFGEAAVYADGSMTPTGLQSSMMSREDYYSALEQGMNNHFDLTRPSLSSQMTLFYLYRPEHQPQKNVTPFASAGIGFGFNVSASTTPGGTCGSGGIMIGGSAGVLFGVTSSDINYNGNNNANITWGFSISALFLGLTIENSYPIDGTGSSTSCGMGVGVSTPFEFHLVVGN